jgi:hypothetical protein
MSLTGSMFAMLGNPGSTAYSTVPSAATSSLLGSAALQQQTATGALQQTALQGSTLQGATLRYEALTMQADDVATQAPTTPVQKLDPVSQAVYDNVMGKNNVYL